ncbi:MAG: tetratricopeptide repeat-containing protein, partial [Pseudomonadota bacterium]
TSAADSQWVEDEFYAIDTLFKARQHSDFPFYRMIATLDGRELPVFARDSLRTDFRAYPHGPTGGELLRLMVGLVGESLGAKRAQLIDSIDEQSEQMTHAVQSARQNGDAAHLLELAASDSVAVTTTPGILCEIADSLIALDKLDESLEVIARAKVRFAKSVRLMQLEGLALRRQGEFVAAQRALGVLYAAGHRDPETLGIYAATWAKRYDKEGDENFLSKSQALYAEAFRLNPSDSYCGVNAASKAALLGQANVAAALAEQVLELEDVTRATQGGKYWEIATHAEVRVLRGEYARASELYQAAVAGSPAEHGSHSTTRDQLEKLIDKLEVPGDFATALRSPFSHLNQ